MFCRIKQIQKSVMNDVSIMPFIRMLDYSAIASNRTLYSWLILDTVQNLIFSSHIQPQKQVFEGQKHGVQPQNGIPGFSLHFPKELTQLSYGYLRFEENVKFLWEGREKSLPSQQGRPFSLPSQKNFLIFFKPKVAIAKFIGKMQTSLVL